MYRNDPTLRTSTQKLGYWLVRAGLLGFVFAAGLISLEKASIIGDYSPGAVAAFSFFTMILGMAFIFPRMLEDENKGLSTMRVLVFMVISVFVLLTLKLGWDDGRMPEVSDNWLYLIGLTFGGKVAQSIAEKFGTRNAPSQLQTPLVGGPLGGLPRVDPPRGFEDAGPTEVG